MPNSTQLGIITALMLGFAPMALAADGGIEVGQLILPLSLTAIGVFLLIIEGTVIPGFGIAGIPGILLMAAGLFFGMRDLSPHILGIEENGVAAISIALIGSLVACTGVSIGLIKVLPKMPGAKRLIHGEGLEDRETPRDLNLKGQVGRSGVARTDLRPAGKVRIDDKDYDVTTNEGWINHGEQVIVEAVHEGHLLVKRVV